MTEADIRKALAELEEVKKTLRHQHDIPEKQWLQVHVAYLLLVDAIVNLERALEDLSAKPFGFVDSSGILEASQQPEQPYE